MSSTSLIVANLKVHNVIRFLRAMKVRTYEYLDYAQVHQEHDLADI